MRFCRFFYAVAFFLLISPAHADFAGEVVGVMDGDTVDVLVSNERVRVRLAHIDAPEKHQAFGARSHQALSSLVFRRPITVTEVDRDRYGRVVGVIHVAGTEVNAEMVRLGMAWVYRKHYVGAALYELERDARASRRGLWVDSSPIQPWHFRRTAPRSAW